MVSNDGLPVKGLPRSRSQNRGRQARVLTEVRSGMVGGPVMPLPCAQAEARSVGLNPQGRDRGRSLFVVLPRLWVRGERRLGGVPFRAFSCRIESIKQVLTAFTEQLTLLGSVPEVFFDKGLTGAGGGSALPNGVQEVAGSNPVAPTFARPVGITSSDWPFSRLWGSFRPQGQSCGQRFDRAVPPASLPRPLDSWQLPSSQHYGRAGSTPGLCEQEARTLGHK